MISIISKLIPPTVIGNLAPNKATSDDYESIDEELIQRVPLAGDQYNEDNAKVLEIWLIIPLFPVGILLGWGERQM